ncbi:hypothetical protein D4764_21G0002910 [Takifugu flavidus]|uniref:Uncharacterized protein n=1 Tax=Takifugu flavidus TaxID=433684 RepID=A0A5C6NFM5_9TELE|nr:hypothetical protein D4764_21G0002910 [Takifugu flavidus]
MAFCRVVVEIYGREEKRMMGRIHSCTFKYDTPDTFLKAVETLRFRRAATDVPEIRSETDWSLFAPGGCKEMDPKRETIRCWSAACFLGGVGQLVL